MKRTRYEQEGIESKELAPSDIEAPLKVQRQASHRRCPFLDTINRQLLDFDGETVCSVTLSNRNVYACLVCGKVSFCFCAVVLSFSAYMHLFDTF